MFLVHLHHALHLNQTLSHKETPLHYIVHKPGHEFVDFVGLVVITDVPVQMGKAQAKYKYTYMASLLFIYKNLC